MTIESLNVWVKDKKVGQLIRENHSYIFQYQNINTLDPQKDLVSLTMPVRAKQYETQVLMPPFQMVLPEGALLETLRTRFAKVMDISNEQREQFGMDKRGILIKNVSAGAARDAGIRKGDILLKLNYRDVNSVKGFKKVLKGLPNGKSVPVLIQRKKSPIFLAIKIPG